MKIELLNPNLSTLVSKDNSRFEYFAKIKDDSGEIIGHIVVWADGLTNLILIPESKSVYFDHRDLQQLTITFKKALESYQQTLLEQSNQDVEYNRLIDHYQTKKELG